MFSVSLYFVRPQLFTSEKLVSFFNNFEGYILIIYIFICLLRSFFFIPLWYFIPASPSDLIGYVAGTVKLNFKKYISAVFLGSVPFVAVYVFFGSNLVNFISNLI